MWGFFMFKNSNYVSNLLKAVLVSLIFTMLAVLLFALILRLFSLGNGIIKPINYLIKTIAVFIGAYLSVSEDKGILKGFISGVIIIIITFIVFSLISSGFKFTPSLLWEIILGGAIGAIAGVVKVNKKRT
jgi:putative membrane protein (TIGR04086 family)